MMINSNDFSVRDSSLSKMIGYVASIVVAAAAFIEGGTVFAQNNVIENIGTSYQSTMRGSTDVAVGDTALSQMRNPATISLQPKGRFDAMFVGIFPHTRWNGIAGGATS